jgi:hypothetical protein
LRYFNVKTSSAHEGTNFGIKEHAAAVLPSHKIDVAGRKLSLQASMKGAQMESDSTYMASSQSLWSQSPTANYVTNLAESILSRASARSHDYSVRRTAVDSWEVHYVGQDNFTLETDRSSTKKGSPIPIFTRIRVVNHSDDFLCCDCGAQQRVGLTCVHTTAVMEDCFPDWKGPTHHDVSPRWWISWMEFAHKSHTKNMTTAILALMENEVPGPRLPGHLPVSDAAAYLPVSRHKSARNRVKNYSRQVLAGLLHRPIVQQEGNALRSIVTAEGLTQESYLLHDNSSEDGDNHVDNDDEDDNPFARSLLADESSTPAMASARDILKPQINEVLQCLDTLKSKTSINKATKLLDDLANELRSEIGKSSGAGAKRNIDSCRTVNLNVEENASRKSRTYASKNC